MRILIAAESQYIAFHGQAIFTMNLAEGLARRGHEVKVLALSERGHAYQSERRGVQIEGLRSLSMGLFHPDTYLSVLPEKRVRQVFNLFRPEIVHVQDHYPLNRCIMRNARRYGVKRVGTNHFMPENLAPYVPIVSKIKPLYNWVLWHWMLDVFNRLDAVAAPSKTAAALLQKHGLRVPVFPISCGVDVSLFQPDSGEGGRACREQYGLDSEKKIFFFVGRVDKEKHLDVLLRAMRILGRKDIQLVIAGNGVALKGLKALAQELDLGQTVRFIGFVPNEHLPGLLNSIDVFAMPSEAELLSIATLEAMACGRPVLAADAVALPELVTSDVNGYLFKPGDADDASRAMTLLADHPERWPDMGRASLEKAEQHSFDHVVMQYEQLYRSVLDGSLQEKPVSSEDTLP